MKKKVLVEISARHCHLSQHDIDKLFGRDYKIKMMKKLSQHSDFAAEETASIMNNGKRIDNVRIIGPVREKRGIEISKTDARYLGVNPKVKIYGDENDPKLEVTGPKGSTNVPAIIKQRHIHMSEQEAEKLGLKKGNEIKVRINGIRQLVFEKVLVRTDPEYRLAVHLDTDEGNAAGIDGKGEGEIV